MDKLNRRQTLAILAAGAAGACTSTINTGDDQAEASSSQPEVFLHGVASGDPDSSSVVLWTRINSDAPETDVVWELSEDASFATIVSTGTMKTGPSRDYTIKAIPERLTPGQTYYYRFICMGETSPIGRTKTLPTGSTDKIGIALVSCSNYPFGYFNAYSAIAEDEAIDLVLHTGDYIYEYGADEWGTETGTAIGRRHAPAREITTLADYRERHAQYKSDAGSKAMHAAHPLVACWDDHESANNPWLHGAQNHQADSEGSWEDRRAASIQAYYEWMPIREPETGRTRAEFWRTYEIGDLATLVTLETRHTARGEQVDYGKYYDTIQSQEDRDAFMRDVMNAPDREMISTEMAKTVKTAMSHSVAAGQVWRLFGNASPIAKMLVPDVIGLGIDPAAAPSGEAEGAGPNLLWKAKWNLPFYTDTWDGYPAARANLYRICKEAGASDLLFLTGDSHSFWANRLYDDAGHSMGIEIGTAGVTSPGDFVDTGWPLDVAEQLDRVFEEGLEEVKWTDNLHQGYVRAVFTKRDARIDYVVVDTNLTPVFESHVLHSEEILPENGSLTFKT